MSSIKLRPGTILFPLESSEFEKEINAGKHRIYIAPGANRKKVASRGTDAARTAFIDSILSKRAASAE